MVEPPKEKSRTPWFEDASALIGHSHHEEPFNDFARQGLLPKKFSQLGPGVAWIDANRKRWSAEDAVLLCVSGRGDKDVAQLATMGLTA